MKKLQNFHLTKTKLFSFRNSRFINLANFSVEGADKARNSLEKVIAKPQVTPELAKFLSVDPINKVGHVDASTINLERKNPKEQATKTAGELDDFIDSVSLRISDNTKVQSLFERDMIASYQKNGGMAKIIKIMKMKSLKITKAHIELRNGYIHVTAEGKEGGNYSVIEFPLKSDIREKAESKHAKVIEKTIAEKQKFEGETNSALEASVKAGKTAPNELEAAGTKQKLPTKIKQIMHKTGLDKKGAGIVKTSVEKNHEYKSVLETNISKNLKNPYSKEKVKGIMERDVVLDKEIYKRWTRMDKSDPELFKQITNIAYVENLLAQKPFEFSLGKLHNAIKDGRDQILDFDDLIDEDGLQIGDKSDFQKDYNEMAPTAHEYFNLKGKRDYWQNEANNIEKVISADKELAKGHPQKLKAKTLKTIKKLLASYKSELEKTKDEFTKIEAKYKKIEKKYVFYTQVLTQAEMIMDALSPSNFKFEVIEKEDLVGNRMQRMIKSAKEKPVNGKPYGPYSLSALTGPQSKLDIGDYTAEKQGEQYGIGVDKKLFDTWKKELISALNKFLKEKYKTGRRDQYGVERSKINKLPAHTLLQMVGDIYGYENLVSGGHLTKYSQHSLVLTSLPNEIAKPNEAVSKKDSPIKKILESIAYTGHSLSRERFTYNNELASKLAFEKEKPFGKVEGILGKIFDKNHIGDKIVGSEKSTFDLTLADGTHRTVYKNHFTTFMTGESAFEHAFAEIEESAALEAAAKGEDKGKAEKYALKKALTILNAYIKIGNLNGKVLGKKKEAASLTAKDLSNRNLTQDQIEALQLGASVEFAQSAALDSLSQISDPAKHEIVRKFLWSHPGLDEEKKANIIKAIEKIDLGTFGVYMRDNPPGKTNSYGIGYAKSWQLPYGLNFTFGASGFTQKGKPGGGVALGVGGTHGNEHVKFHWGIGVGAGGAKDLGILFVGASAAMDVKMTDAYDFSLGVWGGLDPMSIMRGGISIAVKANVERSYKAQRAETYERLGINSLNKLLQNPALPITEKVKAIESNKALGPFISKMTKTFSELQEAMGTPVSQRMREDLMLQTYNIVLNHINVNEDANWTPEFINSIGVSLEISPNMLETFESLITGLFSINIKGKTYVIPIAKPGAPHMNENFLTQEMIAALRERIAKNKRMNPDNVFIDQKRLTNEGLLIRVPGPDGKSMEYRATYTKESIADVSRKDRSFDTMKNAMNDANIGFTRDSDGNTFTMDVQSPSGAALRKTTVMLSTDPKLKPYVDVVAYNGPNGRQQFKLKFKRGFKKFGKFFISRQDFEISHRYHGAPKLTKIMLKTDMTSDSILEAENKQTSLIKYFGYKTAERGPSKGGNNLWGSMNEYMKQSKGTEFLSLDEKDLTASERAYLKRQKEVNAAHEKEYGAEMPTEKELAEMRTYKEIDSIVGKFMKFIRNPRERRQHPELNRAYLKIMEGGVVDNKDTERIMNLLQAYTTQVLGVKAFNKWELPQAKNLVSISSFTNVTHLIPRKGEERKLQLEKLKKLEKVMKGRIPFFLRVADKAFAQTSEGANSTTRKAMLDFLKRRLERKTAEITTNFNPEKIRRENLGQYMGSMAGKLLGKGFGHIEDLDTYGSLPGKKDQLFWAFNIEELSIHAPGPEGKVARAILEIEHPHKANAEGREFIMQPLSIQIGIHAQKYFTTKEVDHITRIKKGEKITPAMEKTFKKFKYLVNLTRLVQLESSRGEDKITILQLGKEFKNAKLVVKPIKVKDFFFERCSNETWGVGTGVDVYATGEEPPLFVGKRVKGRIKIGTTTQVSYVTISLTGAYERRVEKNPPQKGKHLPDENSNVKNVDQKDPVRTYHRPGKEQAGGVETRYSTGGQTAEQAGNIGAAENPF